MTSRVNLEPSFPLDLILIGLFSLALVVFAITTEPTPDDREAIFQQCLPADPTPENRIDCTRAVYGETK